ncbi:hypothetical protein LBBP_00668 [Leptospira borgpetersenii serovar Ballum]|uniref:Uncharacterized protein n=1 Tax=Leptospira borgpetersenii serovar Ballum TaxID=280505 RepID=A0A0S2IMV4_LEPBO|nr:hypothetical protein LBBP_00668 [Leptospira borgpetersenii serovar Ballum]
MSQFRHRDTFNSGFEPASEGEKALNTGFESAGLCKPIFRSIKLPEVLE